MPLCDTLELERRRKLVMLDGSQRRTTFYRRVYLAATQTYLHEKELSSEGPCARVIKRQSEIRLASGIEIRHPRVVPIVVPLLM